MTDAARLMWGRLRKKQLHGYRFRRQHPIGPYIVDFVCLETSLIIELDGGQHQDQVEKDKLRYEWLMQQGFQVLRFWNNQVFNEIDAVLGQIASQLSNSKFNLAEEPAS
jgi:very-short-patch-repair endonuclease